MVLVQVFFSLFTEGTLFSFGKKKATLGVKGVHCSEIIKSKSSCYHWMMKRSSNGVRTVCVKQGEMGKRDSGEWAAGGWSWALEGGRYLGCCWNLFPPTGNYRAVSLPVTTAVPGLPADRPWFNTQIPPHTHVSTKARVLSLPPIWRSEAFSQVKHREEISHFVPSRCCILITWAVQWQGSSDDASSVNWKVEVRGLRSIVANYSTAAKMLLRGSDGISCFVNTSLTLNTHISVYSN